MRMADTSALYALFTHDDVHHKEAMNEVKSPDTILIPSEIWSETIALIHYRQGFDMAVVEPHFILFPLFWVFLSFLSSVTKRLPTHLTKITVSPVAVTASGTHSFLVKVTRPRTCSC